MSTYVFIISLMLSVGAPDGKEHPTKITVEASSMTQCLALRRQAIRMLGGGAGESTTVSLCEVKNDQLR